ncbi:hypothetical protein [Nonomuraea sp. C10]|uniref:hypothetical protein n=1 Tax=Nonomuraea sp. C10 TaxID=2600577 RepID=UPI0011CE2D38|nr:hypothetical protein [Nonomuraea sp. C10]TXK43232.1 hypothetical protein FR742_29915 [Nonomuraea sp. C10]
MLKRSVAAVLMALVVGVAGAPSAAAGEKPWVRLAGTVGTVNDGLPVRLASYSLIWDAGQAFHGYLREGRTFVKTRYREALVAPGGRWVAGVPDRRLWRATEKIDLIDRGTGRTHAVRMPAPVTSPEWSADGGTLLLTAYRKHRDGALTVIGFVTLDARDRVPRLVRTGPQRRVADWEIGRGFRFFFAGPGRVMARHDHKGGVAVYDMDGRRQRFYKGVGAFDEWAAVTVASPSGRLFATVLGENDKGRRIGVVDAATGRVVHRVGGYAESFAGWYDEKHVIVMRVRGRTQIFQRVSLSSGATLDLIREKLVAGPAEYEPHLERVNFVRSASQP